jgi:purine-binding chemotaxis protein CheW
MQRQLLNSAEPCSPNQIAKSIMKHTINIPNDDRSVGGAGSLAGTFMQSVNAVSGAVALGSAAVSPTFSMPKGLAYKDHAAARPVDSTANDAAPEPESDLYVVFALAARRFALQLAVVERSIRIVDVTSLPKAPRIVLGVINAAGRIIPVVDVRKRFGLPDRGFMASDQLLIARTSTQPSARVLALWVDAVEGVVERVADSVPAAVPSHEAEYVTGILRLPDGMVLIHDLGKFLSLDEDRALDLFCPKSLGHEDSLT